MKESKNMVFWLIVIVGALFSLLILSQHHFWLGFSGLLLASSIGFGYWALQRATREANQAQNALLEMREKQDLVQADVLGNLPLGLAYIDAAGLLLWHNAAFARMLGKEGQRLRVKLRSCLPELHFKKNSVYGELVSQRLVVQERMYKVSLQVDAKTKRRIVIFDELTDFEQSLSKEDSPVIGICHIDNFAEVLMPLEEEEKLAHLAEVDRLLNEWGLSIDAFVKRTAEDRYILITNRGGLRECQRRQFDILDKIRSIHTEKRIPITLSIGFGVEEESAADLGRLARTALELALGRGGDQVAVKSPDQVQFYGGNTGAVEKRTRVRARVVASSLKEMINQCDYVLISGHEFSDLDAAGAALGMGRAVSAFGKEVGVVIDFRGGALDKLRPHIDNNAELSGLMVHYNQAVAKMTEKTLVIVVDTHKPSLLPEPQIIEKAFKTVIIDHHRRGEEFIEQAELVYLESYASSTCELVAELIQYLSEEVTLGKVAASAMLAGITVDTKRFVFMTGARTFEAASFLRRSGADPLMVQELLRDPIESFNQRAAILQRAQIHFGVVAVGLNEEEAYNAQVVAAQAADSLLNVEGVKASFVISKISGGSVISARSNGEINVHQIMEGLGGGGHLNIAAARLPDITIQEAKARLISVLREHLEGLSED